MRITTATDTIAVDHPVFLIVGQPGICKTSLGYSFNSLLLDFDQGAHRAANRRDTATIRSWADFELDACQQYSGATIDTVERCLGMMTTAIIQEDARNGANGTLYARGWGVLKQRFGTVLDTLKSWDLDVLLLAHAKEHRDGERRTIRADIPGGSYGEVMKRADFVGYLSLQNGRRILDFNPTDTFIGKNPAGWPPLVVPKIEQAHQVMAELFDAGRAALGRKSEASARIAAAVQTWQTTIANYRTADEYSAGFAALRQIKDSDLPVYAQAHHVLNVAAKRAGLLYDRERERFVDTGVVPPTANVRLVPTGSARAATQQPKLYSALTEVH